MALDPNDNVDVSDLSYREAGIAHALDDDPASAEAMLNLVMNAWSFMDNRRRAKIIMLSLTPEFRAWARDDNGE